MYHEDQRLDIGKQVEGVHREEGWVIVAVRKSFAYRVNHLYNDIEHMYHDSLLVLKKILTRRDIGHLRTISDS